jgi:serine/threonine-protein kinase
LTAKEEGKRFGEIAVGKGFATSSQVDEGLQAQAQLRDLEMPEKIGQILLKRGILNRAQVKIVLSAQGHRTVKDIIEGYQIEAKLGQGGMGAVFRARKTDLDRVVALKILPPKFSHDGPFLQRFAREARIAAQLNHPNIVGCIDTGQSHGHHYIAMEFVAGRTLSDILKERGHLSEDEVLDIAGQMADALAHAHAKALVHRDIKPGNIILQDDGMVKLCDMGLAKDVVRRDDENQITQVGVAVGTPYYISPEQAQGLDTIDGRADIYSLGATLYHLLVGDVPFRASSPAAVLVKHFSEPLLPPSLANPSVSAEVSRLVEITMAKAPRDRFASAKDLRVAVNDVRAGRMPKGPSPGDDTVTFTTLSPAGVTAAFTSVKVTAQAVGSEVKDLGRSRFFVVAAALSAAVTMAALLVLAIGSRDGDMPLDAELTFTPSPAPTEPVPETKGNENPKIPSPAPETNLRTTTQKIAALETDLEEIRARINAWKKGLRRNGAGLDDSDHEKGKALKKAIESLEKRLRSYSQNLDEIIAQDR